MNTKCFHIGLAIWIFAVVPVGFAESYPDRPTAAEMDKNVMMGIQCARGVNERCRAIQNQVPPFTNDSCWYLDQNLMGQMASKIKSLVPFYADQETASEEIADITMYTVAGLFTKLDIGDHASLFTGTPAIGTNPPTYGDYPWRIYEKNLEERYKVVYAMNMTAPVPVLTNKVYYYGFGRGQNLDEAYADAVDNWVETYPAPANITKSIMNSYWENYWIEDWQTHGGPDVVIPEGCPGHGEHMNVSLVGWEAIPAGLVVTCPYSYLEEGTTTTNLRVIGYGYGIPNVDGLYLGHTSEDGNYWQREDGAYYIYQCVNLPPDIFPFWVIHTSFDPYVPMSDVTGQNGTGATPVGWYIWQGESPNPDRFYVSYEIDFGTNTLGPNCAGAYTESGTVGDYPAYSSTNGYTIKYDSGANQYEISAGGNYWYHSGTNVEGVYEAYGFYSEAAATITVEGTAGGPDCSGEYSEVGDGTYINEIWVLDGDAFIISSDTNSAKWTGSDLQGTYKPSGGGAVGTATVVRVQNTGYWDVDEGSYKNWDSHTGGVVTVFYECELKGVWGDYALNTSTDINHSVLGAYVYPSKVGEWHAWGLGGMTEANWYEIYNDGGSWSGINFTLMPFDKAGEYDYPSNVGNPPANSSVSYGFQITSEGKALVDWNFNYCTDNWE